MIRLPDDFNTTTERYPRSLREAFPEVHHYWGRVSPELRMVPKSDRQREDEVAANRSRFEDTLAEAEKVRLAPLRKRPIPVGGGLWRKFKLMVRDTLLYILGDKA